MILFQKIIYRVDLRSNPEVLYLFGDNTKRLGMGGQAGEMRGEPNAVGIATKLLPSMSDNAFFSDYELKSNMEIISKDFQPAFDHVDRGGIVVIPFDGLGTGLSEMPTRCPKTYEYLCDQIDILCRHACL